MNLFVRIVFIKMAQEMQVIVPSVPHKAVSIYPIVAHIEQECDEKIEEIEVRANEEARKEVNRIVKDQCEKISKHYQNKHKQIDLALKVHHSTTVNKAKLECLRARDTLLKDVLKEARKNLTLIAADNKRYPYILKGLIMQGLLQLLEQEVVLRCKESELELIESILPETLREFEKISELKTDVIVDTKKCLPKDAAGGVELSTRDGRISVMSTLESRLDLISGQIVPQIRTALFGANPNRKFFE
uniref:V-type proton ATPase subunit E n=1 Tax=Acrobeloides nanus TaxID=290746 RepID=A0A914C7J2_9BILA